MKKIITAMLITAGITSSLAAESNLYVGLDLINSSNTFEFTAGSFSEEWDNDSSGFKLKFGSALNDGWRLQGYFLHETYDETIFDDKNDALNEIGLDLIKGFEVTPEFSPFIQAGIGYGWMDVEGLSETSIKEVSVKIGAGVMYKVTPAFELLAGVDFQVRKWQDIELFIPNYGTYTVETSEKSTKLYIGANVHF
jgi:opacity protein-like surface antigen